MLRKLIPRSAKTKTLLRAIRNRNLASLLLKPRATTVTPKDSTSHYMKQFRRMPVSPTRPIRHYSTTPPTILEQAETHSHPIDPHSYTTNLFDFAIAGLSLTGLYVITKWLYENYCQPARNEIIIFSGIDDEEKIEDVLRAINYYEPSAMPIIIRNNIDVLTNEIHERVEENLRRHASKTKLQLIILSDRGLEDSFLINKNMRDHINLARENQTKTIVMLYDFIKENKISHADEKIDAIFSSLDETKYINTANIVNSVSHHNRIYYSDLIKQVRMALGDNALEILPLMQNTRIDSRELYGHTEKNNSAETTCYTLGHLTEFKTDILRYPRDLDHQGSDKLSVLEKIWLNFVMRIKTRPQQPNDFGPIVFRFKPHDPLYRAFYSHFAGPTYETEGTSLMINLAAQMGEPLTHAQKDLLRGSSLTAAMFYESVIQNTDHISGIMNELYGSALTLSYLIHSSPSPKLTKEEKPEIDTPSPWH